MTKKLTWRLSKLPTPDEVRELVKDKIITQEEAREILLKEDDIDERSIESFEKEIKFLKEIIEKLSDKPTIVNTIREIAMPYRKWDFYYPYKYWIGDSVSSDPIMMDNTVNCSFSQIN